MRVLKILLWSSLCIGLGVFLASYKVGGKTPLELAQRAVGSEPSQLKRLKDGIGEAIEEVKSARQNRPTERYSPDDRQEIDRLVARRGATK